MFSAAGWRIDAADDRSAGRRADGGVGPGSGIAQRGPGKTVQVRRDGIGIAKATQIGAHVFAGKPQDIGLGSVSGEDRPGDGCKKTTSIHGKAIIH